MPKDAKGHGSNSRGNLSVPDQHQHRILRDTVKNPLKGVFLGGPSAEESENTLRSKFGYSDAEINKLKGVTNMSAAGALSSGPKSAPAPVHSAAGGEGYYSRASAKGGRALGNYGPHPTRDAAAAEAYDKHPNAKQVSTSRGPHGFDIQWHRKG